MSDFTGKSVLITGAGSGIGLATARAFARKGAKLLLSDWNAESGAAAAAECAALGGQAIFQEADVADAQACSALVDRAVAAFGRLDIAFNNAGISGGPYGGRQGAGDYPLAAWDKVIGINLTGVFNCIRAEIPAMLTTGGGVIINTASVCGLISMQQSIAYVAAKHGVVGMTKNVCDDYAHLGIRCCAIAPGITITPLTQGVRGSEREQSELDKIPAARFGLSEEIAETVLFLASPAASYVNGVTLPIDGGYTAR